MTEERKCPLTREQLKAFYSDERVKSALFRQCRDRFVCLRFDWGMVRHLTKHEQYYQDKAPSFVRKDGKPFIAFVNPGNGRGSNPYELAYWIDRGVVEFIPEVSDYSDLDRSDYFVIDLDPKDDQFSFDDLRSATKRVAKAVWNSPLRPLIRELNVRFSGNRSFHLYFRLTEKTDLVKIREAVKAQIDGIADEHLTYHNLRDHKDFILIDIGAIARHRCVRSLYSVHQKTGRVCVPLRFDEVDSFDPQSATIPNVLAGKFSFTDIPSTLEG